MVPFIVTAREHHGVATVEAYAAAQAAHIARRRARGARYTVHQDPARLVARIDANSWIVDCSCGAGNATDPAWRVAYCFGCGAVHTTIVFPDAHAVIEALLIAREDVPRRGWDPGQTIADLIVENTHLGAPVPMEATPQL